MAEHKNQLSNNFVVLFFLILFFIGLIFLAIFLWRSSEILDGNRFFTLFDDAMITMTYAKTLYQTGELVWFPGAERVQGITSFTWTMYMSLLHSFGSGSDVALMVSLTSIILIICSSIVVFFIFQYALKTSPYCLILSSAGASSITFLYPLVFWSLRGMEVGFLAFLALVMFLSLILITSSNLSSKKINFFTAVTIICSVIGVITRLDFAPIALTIILCNSFWSKSKFKFLLLYSIPVFASILLIFVFQYYYYGDHLPNTYRLKVEGYSEFERIIRGLRYLNNYLAIIIFSIFCHLIIIKKGTTISKQLAIICTALLFIASCYSIWVGGDAWEWSRMSNRFITTVLPFFVIITFLALNVCLTEKLAIKIFPSGFLLSLILFFSVLTIYYPIPISNLGKIVGIANGIATFALSMMLILRLKLLSNLSKNIDGLIPAIILFIIILTMTSFYNYTHWIGKGGLHINDDQIMSKEAQALEKITYDKAIIATVWAGAPGYYSNRQMVDLLGFSDAVIAKLKPKGQLIPGHNKWDYSYSIGQLQPDMIFDLWKETNDDLKNISKWGYIKKCHNIIGYAYFLKNSSQIKWEKLKDCAN